MVLIGRARGRWRRVAALTGGFVILVQAVLFGWHHHPVQVSSRHGPVLGARWMTAGPDVPLFADRDCQICFSLGHHRAVPVEFFAAARREEQPLERLCVSVVAVSRLPYLLFQPRAPPQA